MFNELIERWWIIAARGVAALLFGVAAFFAPQHAIALLISMFGVFAIAESVFEMGAGLSLNWLALFLEGVAGGAIGLLTLFYPPAAEMWFVPLVAAWALMTGALELVAAFRLRRMVNGPMVKGEWLLAATGVLSLALGVFAAMQAEATATFTWTLMVYAITSGVLLLALGVNVRSWSGQAVRG